MDRRATFFKFLVEHDALFPYINNLDLEEKQNLFQNRSEFWIVMAFRWSNTPEGYNYWSILNNLWLMRCSTL